MIQDSTVVFRGCLANLLKIKGFTSEEKGYILVGHNVYEYECT